MTDVALIGRFARVCLDCEEPATTANRPIGPVADPRKSSSVQCTAEVQFSFPLCIGLKKSEKSPTVCERSLVGTSSLWWSWAPAGILARGGQSLPPFFPLHPLFSCSVHSSLSPLLRSSPATRISGKML